MGVEMRQNAKPAKGLFANAVSVEDNADAMKTLRALAKVYEKVADRLLDEIHQHSDNLKLAQSLGRHLDWIAARAQMVASFIQAGDCAMSYICASAEARARLMPLVELAARNAAKPSGLTVALFLMEKIDEELRLV